MLPGEYGELLVHIATTHSVQQALLDQLTIITLLGSDLFKAMESSKTEGDIMEQKLCILGKQLFDKAIIPCTNMDWASLEQRPCLPDDKTLVDMFSAKEGVFFVDTGLKVLGKQSVRPNQRRSGFTNR